MSQGKEFITRLVSGFKAFGSKVKKYAVAAGVKIKELAVKAYGKVKSLVTGKKGAKISKNNVGGRPVSRSEMTKAQWIWKEIKRNKVAYLMIAPFMILFFIFTVLPVFLSAFLSLTDFNMLQMPSFKGFSNFSRLLLDDEIFLIAAKNTLIFAAITGPVSYIMALLIAWFINELPPKIRAVVTLIFYAPSISGSAYMVWQTLFSSDSYGWVNAFLIKYGFETQPILFFQNAEWVMPLCIVVALWTSLGTAFLSFIAGLQGIDRSLYEAASVDGIKNRWQELWYITLPSMRPQLMFGAVLSITQSFGFGAIVTALCGMPSVDYAAHTIMHHLDDYGGQRYEIGYASAIAVILFIVMITANTLIKKGLSKVGQ
jgi:multiple sugar transport system permease protein